MAETTQHSTAAADATKKDAELRKAQEEQRAKLAKGKPTPTQEENDRAVKGEHITEHADDGSGPDPNAPAPAHKSK
jgi:hypothetical protein